MSSPSQPLTDLIEVLRHPMLHDFGAVQRLAQVSHVGALAADTHAARGQAPHPAGFMRSS